MVFQSASGDGPRFERSGCVEIDGPTSCGNATKGVSIKVEVVSSRGAAQPLPWVMGTSTREDNVL